VADHLRTGLIIEALAAALATRTPPAGVIFHSDRGCQYTSNEFADFCAENGVVRSMGRRATCFDNAVSRIPAPPRRQRPGHLRRDLGVVIIGEQAQHVLNRCREFLEIHAARDPTPHSGGRFSGQPTPTHRPGGPTFGRPTRGQVMDS
jgi:hypothetical protein